MRRPSTSIISMTRPACPPAGPLATVTALAGRAPGPRHSKRPTREAGVVREQRVSPPDGRFWYVRRRWARRQLAGRRRKVYELGPAEREAVRVLPDSDDVADWYFRNLSFDAESWIILVVGGAGLVAGPAGVQGGGRGDRGGAGRQRARRDRVRRPPGRAVAAPGATCPA